MRASRRRRRRVSRIRLEPRRRLIVLSTCVRAGEEAYYRGSKLPQKRKLLAAAETEAAQRRASLTRRHKGWSVGRYRLEPKPLDTQANERRGMGRGGCVGA